MKAQGDLFSEKESDEEVEQVEFWCPACDEPHSVMVKGTKWTYNGNATFPTIDPSMKTVTEKRICHAKVCNGQIEYLEDSTHGMAGQTVTL